MYVIFTARNAAFHKVGVSECDSFSLISTYFGGQCTYYYSIIRPLQIDTLSNFLLHYTLKMILFACTNTPPNTINIALEPRQRCHTMHTVTPCTLSHHAHCTIFLLTTTANRLWTDTLSHAKLAAIFEIHEGHVGHVQLRWRNFIFMRFKEIHGSVGPWNEVSIWSGLMRMVATAICNPTFGCEAGRYQQHL